VVATKVVTVEVVPSDKTPQLADSQARLAILPELSITIRMFGVAMLETNGGEAV
jgi:hypothetical protein